MPPVMGTLSSPTTLDNVCSPSRLFSPVCPQSEPQYASLSEDGVAPADLLVEDELHCLNMTITGPRPKDSGNLHPVMVWIHGYVSPPKSRLRKLTDILHSGGENGSGSNWLYDSGALVHKSIKSHEPVVVVNIK
jgi:hypothetical protein